MNDVLAVLAVLSSVVFTVSAVAIWAKPPRRLRSRVRPYSSTTRMELGLSPDPVGRTNEGLLSGQSTMRGLLGPMLAGMVYPLARLVMPADDQ